MDFFKQPPMPRSLNVVTLIFIVVAVQVFIHFKNVYGAVYVFCIFILWALTCIYTQKYILKKQTVPTRYFINNVFILTAIMVATELLMNAVFGI